MPGPFIAKSHYFLKIRYASYPIDIGYEACLILVEFISRRADQRGEGSG
jgi:hypothetical protein